MEEAEGVEVEELDDVEVVACVDFEGMPLTRLAAIILVERVEDWYVIVELAE